MIWKIKLINKRKFRMAMLNINIEIFVIHVLILKAKILVNFLIEIIIPAEY